METREALLAAMLMAGGAGAADVAVADTAATYEPAQLPAIGGKVAIRGLRARAVALVSAPARAADGRDQERLATPPGPYRNGRHW